MSNVSIAGYAGWPAYDTFLIMLLSSRPVYDPNPLRPNPNPKKPVSGLCRVRGLGRTLTPLVLNEALLVQCVFGCLIFMIFVFVFFTFKISTFPLLTYTARPNQSNLLHRSNLSWSSQLKEIEEPIQCHQCYAKIGEN